MVQVTVRSLAGTWGSKLILGQTALREVLRFDVIENLRSVLGLQDGHEDGRNKAPRDG